MRRLFRILLWPFSLIWGVVAMLRRILYEGFGMRRCVGEELGVGVWVIGNITVGGTGKTPLIIALGKALMERGGNGRLGVLSRGYGRADRRYGFAWVDTREKGAVGLYGDEPVEICGALGNAGEGVAVAVCGDRVEGVRRMVAEKGVGLVLLDDGMQHLPLKANGYVMVADYHRQPQGDFCLPAGNLREFGWVSEKVNWLVVNKCDAAVFQGDAGIRLKSRFSRYLKPEFRKSFAERVLLTQEKVKREVVFGEASSLADMLFFGLLGIAGGERILAHWMLLGEVKDGMVFRDHYSFEIQEIEAIVEKMELEGLKGLRTTRKDWMRLSDLLEEEDGKLRKLWDSKGIAVEILWTEPQWDNENNLKAMLNEIGNGFIIN